MNLDESDLNLDLKDLTLDDNNGNSSSWNDIESKFAAGMKPDDIDNKDKWSNYDIKPDENNRVLFISNIKTSKNISDENLKISVWSMLVSAGANKNHFEKKRWRFTY